MAKQPEPFEFEKKPGKTVKEVMVEMNDEEFLRVMQVMFDGNNAERMRVYGSSNVENSEFFEMLLTESTRKDLLRRYEIILNTIGNQNTSFPVLPYLYEEVRNGDTKGVQKAPINRFFGGWKKEQGKIPGKVQITRLETSDNEWKRGFVFNANRVNGNLPTFIDRIRYLYELVQEVDKNIPTGNKLFEFSRDGMNKKREWLSKFLSDFLTIIPHKIINGIPIYLTTKKFKTDIIDLLREGKLAFMNEAISKGYYFDKFYQIQVLLDFLRGVLGQDEMIQNYVLIDSQAIPTVIPDPKSKQKGETTYCVRCLYMDVLGNIGYGQVETSSNYGSTEEAYIRSIVGLCERQAIIKAFPSFRSLKYKGEEMKPIGNIEKEFEKGREEWKRLKETFLNKENYKLGYDTRNFTYRLIPKKDTEELGMATRQLLIEPVEVKEKAPKLLLNVEEKNPTKKLARVEDEIEEKEVEPHVDMRPSPPQEEENLTEIIRKMDEDEVQMEEEELQKEEKKE